MGAQVGGKKGGAIAAINVTPLVDVVLVLLIIFMVVTPMLGAGVDVKLPMVKTAEEEKDMGQHLVVSVRNDGKVFIDRDPITMDRLVAEIEVRRGNKQILLKGDKTVTYRQVREVMDVIHKDVPNTDTMMLAAEKKKE
jgi:biopolymer transport protein ExbD